MIVPKQNQSAERSINFRPDRGYLLHFRSMNRTLIFVLIVVTTMSVQAQKNRKLFREFQFSFNRAHVSSPNDYISFGMGAYHYLFELNHLHFIFGLEYNRNSVYVEDLYNGHNSRLQDVTYIFHNVSIPLTFRLNIGERFGIFVEAGGYLDFNIYSRYHGKTFYIDYQTGKTQTFYFDERIGIPSPDYGPVFGGGIKFTAFHRKWIIKADYKLGMVPFWNYMDVLYNHYYRLSVGIIM